MVRRTRPGHARCSNKANATVDNCIPSMDAIENYPACAQRMASEFLERFAERVDDADFDLWTNVAIDKVDLKAKKHSSGERRRVTSRSRLSLPPAFGDDSLEFPVRRSLPGAVWLNQPHAIASSLPVRMFASSAVAMRPRKTHCC